jgi:hypothetical protein
VVAGGDTAPEIVTELYLWSSCWEQPDCTRWREIRDHYSGRDGWKDVYLTELGLGVHFIRDPTRKGEVKWQQLAQSMKSAGYRMLVFGCII